MFRLELEAADFLHDADQGLDTLEHAVDVAAHNAGDEGIKEEQRDHPYTDRTYNLSASAHVEPTDDGEPGVDMVWPADYASFVDQGTSTSKPYPFTPIAEKRAEQVLAFELENAVDNFKDKVGG
jgi:hypothetical protein